MLSRFIGSGMTTGAEPSFFFFFDDFSLSKILSSMFWLIATVLYPTVKTKIKNEIETVVNKPCKICKYKLTSTKFV